MPTDLERFRDFARIKAGPFDNSTRSQPCSGHVTGKLRHDWCNSDACRCECHQATDADRALWTRLADEIDAYLAPAQDVLPFGEAADA